MRRYESPHFQGLMALLIAAVRGAARRPRCARRAPPHKSIPLCMCAWAAGHAM